MPLHTSHGVCVCVCVCKILIRPITGHVSIDCLINMVSASPLPCKVTVSLFIKNKYFVGKYLKTMYFVYQYL